MGYRTAFREIMREYETDRDRAGALLAARRRETYRKTPRVGEIDARLTEIGLQLVRQALAEGDTDPLRTESAALRTEKAALLKTSGVPEDYFTFLKLIGGFTCKEAGVYFYGCGLVEKNVNLRHRASKWSNYLSNGAFLRTERSDLPLLESVVNFTDENIRLKE